MIDHLHLDHVAVAAESQALTWRRYGGDLPGRFLGGGVFPGFANYQVEYAGGMRLEVLEPAMVEANDFLRRFLDRSGPGPHHLTYKVDDIEAALVQVERAGYRPIGVSLDGDSWKELFLHPRDIPGIVVQIAWAGPERPEPALPPFPPRRVPEDAALERVVHAVADMDEALRLFAGLLGGSTRDRGEDADGRWVELAWQGGGVLRLVTPAAETTLLTDWIGDRSGRLHHLAFATTDPGGVNGAVALEGPDELTWEVPPGANLGVRLRLRAPDHPAEVPGV